jgi:hypothetical protein
MKNMKIKTLLFATALVSLTSCLKEGRMNTDPGAANAVVEIANTGDNVTSSGIAGFYSDLGSVAAGSSKSFNINVRYAGPGTAPSDITVTLATDQATLTTYNAANGTNKVVPPTTVYSFPTTVTIPKGATEVTVDAKITVSPDFDFNKAYGIPVKITQVSTGIVSGNYGAVVYSFGVRNIFDGHYTVTGTMVDAANPGITGRYPMDVGLVTSGATQVQLSDYATSGIYHSILSGGATSYYGAFGVVFNLDASNKVISVVNAYGQPASNGRSAEIDPSGVNTWDPTTKTLKVKYWMNQPSVIAGHRVSFDETFTYLGVR